VEKLVPQVHIKAYITSIDEEYFHEMGIKLLSESTADQARSAQTGRQSLLRSVLWSGLKMVDSRRLGAELSAMESEGKGQVLSSPELVTLQGRQAFVETGDEIPITMQNALSEGSDNVIYKKAVLRLSVTPHVMGDEVMMAVHIVQDKQAPAALNGRPIIHTRQVDTVVRVKNQATVVLGGIYEMHAGKHRQCFPGLHHLPLIGRLFCRHENNASKHQLMVFMTPTILSSKVHVGPVGLG
jgi:type IV pilus assembly protein PilQ